MISRINHTLVARTDRRHMSSAVGVSLVDILVVVAVLVSAMRSLQVETNARIYP